MLFSIILLSLFTHVSGECTNMLFIEHNIHNTKTGKYSSNIIQQGLIWKDHISHYCNGIEIYTELDSSKYELMTHAYYQGLIIHRVCEKNTNYVKYGKITQLPIRGFVVDVENMFETDLFLYNNKFVTYAVGHRRDNFHQYYKNIRKNEYKKKLQEREEYFKNNKFAYYVLFILKYSLYICICFALFCS